MDYAVSAIAISGTNVYASGGFWSAGTCTTADGCKYIAKWDGVTWSALNKGFFSSDYYGGRVSAIALKSGAVFAGGLFSAAGNAADADTPASNIAVFSPSTSTSTTISTTVPAEGSTLASSPSTLTVKFSAAVVNDSTENPKSATSLSNYMLVGPGLNSVFDTTVDAPAICSSTHTPSGDDLNISIASISYNAATFTATLTIAPASLPLAAGPYRLYVCGAASINDMLGNKINGGANFPVNFSVTRSAAAAAADKYSKLPKTGFAPNRISVLPQ